MKVLMWHVLHVSMHGHCHCHAFSSINFFGLHMVTLFSNKPRYDLSPEWNLNELEDVGNGCWEGSQHDDSYPTRWYPGYPVMCGEPGAGPTDHSGSFGSNTLKFETAQAPWPHVGHLSEWRKRLGRYDITALGLPWLQLITHVCASP